jgi:hypothetical protein
MDEKGYLMAGLLAPSPGFVERRSGIDRRRRPTSPFSLRSFRGSRQYGRRREDRAIHFYVDRYGLRSVITVVATLILCLADAFMTMYLIALGAYELNPVMDFFLRMGPISFLLAKYLFTGTALVCLLVHKNYPLLAGRFTTKSVLVIVPILYTLLIGYELLLAFVVIPSM